MSDTDFDLEFVGSVDAVLGLRTVISTAAYRRYLQRYLSQSPEADQVTQPPTILPHEHPNQQPDELS